MCIAIVKTKQGKITDEQLRNCFEHNPHGAGFGYATNGQLYYIKGIFDVEQFIKVYHEVEAVAEGAFLIHCRISTAGLINKDNCHPHVVHDNCIMIHNGILDIDVPKDSVDSDTVIFVNNILRPLPRNFMLDDGIINLISYTIGYGNKFCFLNECGEYAIANEDEGEWVDGVWFSNDSYKERKKLYLGCNGFYKGNDYMDYRGVNHYYDDYDYEDGGLYDLSKTERDYILDVIAILSPEQLIKLGNNPVYNVKEGVLKRYATDTHDVHLYDLDGEIGEMYDFMYYEDLFEQYENKTIDDATEDWDKYFIKTYSEKSTTEQEDYEFDTKYADYAVPVFYNDLEDVELIDLNDTESEVTNEESIA